MICFFLLIGLTGLSARLFDLQFQEKQRYEQTSRLQRFAVVRQSPQRGLITDRRGRVLAASTLIYNVFAEPRRLRNAEQYKLTAEALQPLLDVPGYELSKQILQSRNPGFVRLDREIPEDRRQAVLNARIPGVGIEEAWKRHYPNGPLTAHAVGFIGADQEGLAGVEMKYDSVLKGQGGQETFVVDVLRRPLAADPEGRLPVQNGDNVVLTIDVVIQQIVREALHKKIQEYEAQSGIGLVMDPWTGAILAMVSLPDFDPQEFSKASPDQLKNRILSDPFEPGSIFKPIVAAIALDSGAITKEEMFYCEDGYWGMYGGIHEFGNHQFGNLNVRGIILNSSNIGMAKIGLKMSPRTLHDGLALFGIGRPTGVDLAGEEPGLLRPVSKWSKYSPTRIAFGHEVSVTALQMVQAYCILANGGTLIQPHLVRAIVDAQGRLTDVTPSVVGAGYVIKPETARWMVREALTAVVTEGTGEQAAIEGVQVFGKTGTANIALPTGGYDTSNYVSSFIGGAPAENPKAIVMISIRKPNRALGKGYSGGRVAAPVFKEIMEKTLAYLDSQ
jgi:cell division protein FtsI/penicillin-binding protein 2